MTAHVHLGLVFHQHQPVGNYGFVFDELFQKSYEPLVACLERHPGVKAGLHYSGPLLDWLLFNRPAYIERVRALVVRGQVEMLGGGYYEPVLPSISEADRIGQMTKMRNAITEVFGTRPAGMWLPERVWEPSLPTSIAAAGYRWTVVDDVHFQANGWDAADVSGWYLTEDQGSTTGIFGSSTAFRYLVPWGAIDACIDFLRNQGDRRPGSLVTMGDDGEKFGGWPTTYQHCWENGWVESFFSRLEEEAHWIETVHLGTWQAQKPAEGLIYLPTTSYMEMGEWSLTPGAQHALEDAMRVLRDGGRGDLTHFLRGGYWRNFLVRYPEMNLLHKRLLHLSRQAHQNGNAEALEHIWKAQCNCPYWHGVFGGVYLQHIRDATFGHLAQADALLNPGARPADTCDWNFDGRDEICLRSGEQAVIVNPAEGGRIEHWDLRQRGWHLTHAIARRPEAYHARLGGADEHAVQSIHDGVRLKDPAAAGQALNYDRGLRLAAQETIVAGAMGRQAYEDLRLSTPAVAAASSYDDGSLSLRLTAGGLSYDKTIALCEGALVMTAAIPANATLYSEWNLSLPQGEHGAAPEFRFEEGQAVITTGQFQLTAAHSAHEAWVTQLFSVSNTEGGVELAPQGWSMVFRGTSGDTPSTVSIRWTVQ